MKAVSLEVAFTFSMCLEWAAVSVQELWHSPNGGISQIYLTPISGVCLTRLSR